jgi:hypothetical protein
MHDSTNPSADNMRFFVSKESAAIGEVREGAVPLESFAANAQHMKEQYQKHYRKVKESLRLTDEQMFKRYGMTPESYIDKFAEAQYAHMDNIAVGYSGEGKIVSMPKYYAYMAKALEKEGVDVRTRRTVEKVEKIYGERDEKFPAGGYPEGYPKDGYIVTLSDGNMLVTRALHLTAGHKNPQLLNKVPGAAPCPEMAGTYYSNAMVIIKLPATDDEVLRRKYATPGFVLQGPVNGCAYTPVKAPGSIVNPDDKYVNCGYATLYYPDHERGNQLRSQPYDPSNPSLIPEEWDLLAAGTQPVPAGRVASVMKQAEHYYPFLKGNQKFHRAIVRSVFNASTPENPGGTLRNVRDIPNTMAIIAPGVTVGSTPKWTTGALVALNNVHGILRLLGRDGLPVLGRGEGMGPAEIDLGGFVERYGSINIEPHEVNKEDIKFYAKQQGYPETIVEKPIVHNPEVASSRRMTPHYQQETISFAVKHRSVGDVVKSHPKGRRFAEAVKQSDDSAKGRS